LYHINANRFLFVGEAY